MRMSNILLVVRDEECDWLAVDVIDLEEGKYIDKVDCCIRNSEHRQIDKAELVYSVMEHFGANRVIFDKKTVTLKVIYEFHQVLYKNNQIMDDGGWIRTLD